MSPALAGAAAAAGTRHGIACMVAATLLLTLQDATVKWLAASYGFVDFMFWRALLSMVPLALLVWAEGGPRVLRTRVPGLEALRSLVALGTTVAVVLAYARLPFADALAIMYSSPILIAALSGPLLGERVGLRRWGVVVAGFAGVLLIARPGLGGFAPLLALLPISAAALAALRDIVTRRLGRHDSPTTILVYSQVGVLAGGLACFPVTGITPPRAEDLGLFALSATLLIAAHWLTIKALQLAPAATVAPFRYLSLVWASAVGFAVWGNLPEAPAVAGMALIGASGLLLVRLERRR